MYMMVLTTFSGREEAERVAGILLREKLAACVQLKEIESHYMWEGVLQKDAEIQGVIKTRESLYERVEECIIRNHSYDTPQVVAVDISRGSQEYLKWLEEETLS